jgi:hypothetical protein
VAEDDRAAGAAKQGRGESEEIDRGAGGGAEALRPEIGDDRGQREDRQVDVEEIDSEADASGEYRAACGRRQDFGPGQARWHWQPPIVVLRCCEGR